MRAMRSLSAFVGVLAVASATRVSQTETPMNQVIIMLKNMVKTGNRDMAAEATQFAKFKQWCDDTIAETTRQISDDKMDIEQDNAAIEKNSALAEQMRQEIAQHESDIDCWKGDQSASTSVRAIERADYEKLHQDYSESITALKQAIKVLQKQNYDRKQADAPPEGNKRAFEYKLLLIQKLPIVQKLASVQQIVSEFLQQAPTGLDVKNKQAHGYEFQSGKVIQMLEDLDAEFVEERRKIERKEQDHINEYEKLSEELADGIKFAEADIEEKNVRLSEYNAAKTEAEGDLADHTGNLKSDEEYLSSSRSTCEVKATDFKARTKLRKEELEAINKAIEILSTSRGAGHANTHLPKMPALMQILGQNPWQTKAAEFLRQRASRFHSTTLAQVASKVGEGAGGDVFKKVRQMIKDLIVKLMEEENEEAKQKGWCDKELATNEQARDKYTTQTEQLAASIDQNTAKIATLQTSIEEKNAENTRLVQELKDMTAQREEEKFENEMTIRDAKEGQETVQKAIVVLKEFYAKASQATQLVQSQRNTRDRTRTEAPEIFDAPYQGMSTLKGGVVGMMETIMSDFDRLEQETTAEEEEAVKNFNMLKNENEQRQAENGKNVEHMTEQLKQAQTDLAQEKDDFEDAKENLAKADRYYEKLKPTCVNAGESHQERIERRQAEIESLEDALKILNGQVV